MILTKIIQITLLLFIAIMNSACFESEGSSKENSQTSADSKYSLVYKDMPLYAKSISMDAYQLTPLSDADFYTFSLEQQHQIANKLLSTLFFAYPPKELQEKIDSQEFISSLFAQLHVDQNDRSFIETQVLDEVLFRRYNGGEQEVADILARFYLMPKLDRYYFKNWSAYILTQTIMFSPAYELSSSHSPNIERVYNRFVTLLDDNTSLEYSSYLYMTSDDNWRRFRSPEDNGREMLEIFAFDMDDTHVPIAAQALQNWELNRDNDTLVISLNENTQALSLFGTTIYNGEDFYRELIGSDQFIPTVSYRLAQFFFGEYSHEQLNSIADSITKSNPQTWQDILLQIVFSKEYLLKNNAPKSAEESFFSLTKKLQWKHNIYSFRNFKSALENMRQASMKYKLGKSTRVPLDTLSFAHYHAFLRETILLQRSDPQKLNEYSAWGRQGWDDTFIADDFILYDAADHRQSLYSLIDHIFFTILSRKASQEELEMFAAHMLRDEITHKVLDYSFDIFSTNQNQEAYKRNITMLVLDYISRLENLYLYKEVR